MIADVKTGARLLVISLLPTLTISAQAPTFRSGVELVEVTAIVRDSDGRVVQGLTQADFSLLERGQPQRISKFERISIPLALSGAGKSVPQTPRDVASNDAVAGRRVFVLVLDALHVAPTRTQAVRQRATEFIEGHVGPADVTAVLSPGGLAAATQDFTSDKARLLAAVQQFAGSKLRSATVEVAEEEAARQRDPIAVALHNGKDPSDQERANHAQALADTIAALARHLARVANRRTAVLLFSEGIDYDVTDVSGRVQQYSNEVVRANQRAIDALMRANASVYAIDPRGLASSVGDAVETPVFDAKPSVVAGPSVEAEYSASIRSLRNVSDATGGFAAVDRRDFTSAFAKIVEDSSEYYVLGYVPEIPGKPGEFREITVHVDRPGVHVIARKGYTIASTAPAPNMAPRAEEPVVAPPFPGRDSSGRRAPAPALPDMSAAPARAPVTNDLNALLASPLSISSLLLRVQAIPFRGDARKSAVDVVVEVVGRSLRFAERAGRFNERVELALLTVDDGARAGNGRSATFDLRLTPEQHQGVTATGIRWIPRLELAPGRHQIRVAARGIETGTSGLVAYDIDVPKFDAGRLDVSGVALTSLPSVLSITQGTTHLGAALKTPPSAARTFVSGDRITIALEAYIPPSTSSADITADIEDAQGGRRAVDRKTVVGQRQAHTESVVFGLETTPLAPGPYVLRIDATAAGDGTSITRRVPFDVIVR